MSNNREFKFESNPEATAIFQKRIQDLILDLAEAESRTHNSRFLTGSLRRKIRTPLTSYIRRRKTLYNFALRFKNLR
jgi:hypothetical protein